MIVYITKACVQKSDYLFVEEKILEQVLIHDLDNFWNLFLVVHNTTAYNSEIFTVQVGLFQPYLENLLVEETFI